MLHDVAEKTCEEESHREEDMMIINDVSIHCALSLFLGELCYRERNMTINEEPR